VTGEMRARAKTINFATIYGQGALALSRQLGITVEEAKAFIKHYFERFAGVRAWLDKTVEEARQRGIRRDAVRAAAVYLRAARPEFQHPRVRRADGDELTAPGIGRRPHQDRDDPHSCRAQRDRLKTRKMLLQVHDELVFETPESERVVAEGLVKREMEGVADLAVPLVVSVGAGKNWIDAKG
jgi:DNA polymerase-1